MPVRQRTIRSLVLSEIFEQLFKLVQQITEWLGYPGIFSLMLFENLLPPVPSEMVMPFAGSLVAEGKLTFLGVLLSGTLGAWAGAMILYYIGYRLGREPLEHWLCRYGKYLFISPQDLDKTLDLFQRHGNLTVFVARLIPGARSLISIPAGVNRMPLGSFVVLTILGTIVWNVTLISAGSYLGQNWQSVLGFIDTYENVLWAVLGVLLLIFLIRKFQQRGQIGTQGCEES